MPGQSEWPMGTHRTLGYETQGPGQKEHRRTACWFSRDCGHLAHWLRRYESRRRSKCIRWCLRVAKNWAGPWHSSSPPPGEKVICHSSVFKAAGTLRLEALSFLCFTFYSKNEWKEKNTTRGNFKNTTD